MKRILIAGVVVAGLAAGGWWWWTGRDAGAPAQAAAPPAPAVTVVPVTQETVPRWRDYTGVTEAVRAVDLQAQVTGYLAKRTFEEGSDVDQGALLYVIDPKPFQAQVDQAQAQLEVNQSELKFAQEELGRTSRLARDQFASVESLQMRQAQEREAKANVALAQAELEISQIDLGYTEIRAPFAGRVSRTLINIGNLVVANETELTSLVQLDPIYAMFAPPEGDVPLIRRHQAQAPLKVTVRLPGDNLPEATGTLTFLDNAVDRDTGTLLMRATLDNPDKAVLPGQYVQVRVHLDDQPNTMLVPQTAIGENQSEQYVMVVGDDDKVARKAVETGRQWQDKRVITKGLSAGDKVITAGLQHVRAGMTVKPQPPKPADSSKAAQPGDRPNQ